MIDLVGWVARHFSGGHHARGRERQLDRYARACDRVAAFLESHGEDAARYREIADHARGLRDNGWDPSDLDALGRMRLAAPWPAGKGRDFGAPAPEWADDGDALFARLAAAALELRATGPA